MYNIERSLQDEKLMKKMGPDDRNILIADGRSVNRTGFQPASFCVSFSVSRVAISPNLLDLSLFDYENAL